MLVPLGTHAVTPPIGVVASGADVSHGVITVIDMDMVMDMAAAGAVACVPGLALSGYVHSREEKLFWRRTSDISPVRAGADASEPCRI